MFFPALTKDDRGIVPAPFEAVLKKDEPKET